MAFKLVRLQLLAELSESSTTYKAFMGMMHDLYAHFMGILLIVSVVMTLVSIFFLMYTRDDKQVSMFKVAIKRIWITVTLFLIVGTIYVFCMGLALNNHWDPDTSVPASEAQSAASMISSSTSG